MISLRALTLGQAQAAAANGALDLAAVEQAMGQARRRENPELGAFTWLNDADEAQEATAVAVPSSQDPAGPLAGFSAAIKANICGRNWRNDCGSRLLADYISPYDATAVARLRAVGARFPGTTAMDEFGMGSSCEYGAWGPARNPWRSDRTAGGSSGGSAAAVAAGLAWYGLGTDTGGSVRYPAHCCGLVGFKPTYGRISRHGLIAFASSLDTIGVLARDVADAALVAGIIAGPDPHDATCLTIDPPDWSAALQRSAQGLRVGVPWALIKSSAGEPVQTDLTRSVTMLQDSGLVCSEVALDLAADAVAVYTVIACAEASSNLARYDGSVFGCRQSAATYQGTVRASRRLLGPEVKRRILLGTHVLSRGYRDRFYLRARRRRRELREAFDRIFAQVDVIALPTAAEAAFPLGSRLNDPVAMYRTDLFTVPASLAGLPAITVPTALDPEGLPLSLQLIGRAGDEATILSVAAALERACTFRSMKEAPWQRPL